MINKLQESINKALEKDSIKAMNETLKQYVKQNLHEMSIAWIDKTINTCCWVENPTGYNNKYFKYVNSFSYIKGDSMATISLLSPQYLEHKQMKGKKPWKLTSKEKKQLIAIMNKPNRTFPNYTNWQITLAQYNMDNFGIDIIDTLQHNFEEKQYPDAFDINYPMPDYTKL